MMSNRQSKCPTHLIAHVADRYRGINWWIELEKLTELFTVLKSYDVTCPVTRFIRNCHKLETCIIPITTRLEFKLSQNLRSLS